MFQSIIIDLSEQALVASMMTRMKMEEYFKEVSNAGSRQAAR
jgi:hypothetical protein